MERVLDHHVTQSYRNLTDRYHRNFPHFRSRDVNQSWIAAAILTTHNRVSLRVETKRITQESEPLEFFTQKRDGMQDPG